MKFNYDQGLVSLLQSMTASSMHVRTQHGIPSAEHPTLVREKRHRTQETAVTDRGLSSTWRICPGERVACNSTCNDAM